MTSPILRLAWLTCLAAAGWGQITDPTARIYYLRATASRSLLGREGQYSIRINDQWRICLAGWSGDGMTSRSLTTIEEGRYGWEEDGPGAFGWRS